MVDAVWWRNSEGGTGRAVPVRPSFGEGVFDRKRVVWRSSLARPEWCRRPRGNLDSGPLGRLARARK